MIEPSAANAGIYFAQILIVVSLAAVAGRLLDIPLPRVRLAYWRAVLVLCLALPLLALAQPSIPELTPSLSTPAPVLTDAISRAADTSPSPVTRFPLGTFVLALLLAGIWIRGAWLAVGYARLQRIRRHAPLIELDDEMERLHNEIAPHAEIRRLIGAGQPATFGFWRPIILLPDSVASLPTAERLAIFCHELVHVRRRDWVWTIAEELLRTLFWFHPAMRYAISRVQATREEVVDAEVIARTGARHEYLRALIVFAKQPELARATSFVRRNQLKSRLLRIATEVHMSLSRLSLVASTLCAVLVGAIAVAGSGLRYDVAAEQQFADDVPVNAVEFTAPVSRAIVRLDRPRYPASAWQAGIGAQLSFVIRIDPDGSVTLEGRPNWQVTVPDTTPPGALETFWADQGWREFLVSIDDAVRQWRYVPSTDAAIVTVGVTFRRPLPVLPVNSRAEAERRLVMSVRLVPMIRLLDGEIPHVGGSIRPPTRLVNVEPIYPELAIAARVQGVVVLDVLIDTDGSVITTRTIRSIPLLDLAARDAVMQWRFEPTLIDGVPRQVRTTVTVSFALPGQ